MDHPLEVEIFYTELCPHVEETERELRKAAADLDVEGDLRIRLHRVTSPEEARDLGFVGSPTLRVNGRSIVPLELEEEPRWNVCRQYVSAHRGIVPFPPASTIRQGLADALEHEG